MLLSFTVENWMSYRDGSTFSLVGTRERQHSESLAKLPGFRSKKALPVAAIYGGNASGKTSLFKAISSLRRMVVGDVGVNGLLPIRPFKLDSASTSRPTCFDITFLARKNVYRLIVEAFPDRVLYESLEILKGAGSSSVYERDSSSDGFFSCDPRFFDDPDHVAYAAKSTRPNQLFLASGMAQNVMELSDPYSWFADTLELVGVESQSRSFATALSSKKGFLEYAGRMLCCLDTGIIELVGEAVGEEALPEDGVLRKKLAELGSDGIMTIVVDRAPGDYGFEMLTVQGKDGCPHVESLRTVHRGADGKRRRFSLSMESSGTQRLMGLLPMLFELTSTDGGVGEKVYVVDELDRCLHTMLTSRLIKDFLSTCRYDTRKQLLFTTHDLLLMDQSVMRRDEMYVAQRNANGCSELIGLNEYDGIRYDKDLVRSYLDGRFGGIPALCNGGVGE